MKYSVKEMTLELFFPPTCMVCGKLTGRGGICPACEKKLPWIRSPRCLCCGMPIRKETEEYCTSCSSRERSFDGGRGAFSYHSAVRKAVLDLKNHGKRQNAVELGLYMAAVIQPLILVWKPTCIIPIPLDRKKRRQRGYNQAELLAREIGRRLKLPVNTGLLRRKGKGREQKNLGRLARAENLKEAFFVDTSDQKPLPASLLLVDDIYTTGSTLEAAAAKLKEAGADKVYFITACMGTDRN